MSDDAAPSSRYLHAPGVPTVQISGYPKRRPNRAPESADEARLRSGSRSTSGDALPEDPSYADFFVADRAGARYRAAEDADDEDSEDSA